MKEDHYLKHILQKFIRDECDTKEIAHILAYLKETGRPTHDFPNVEQVLDILEELPKMSEATSERILHTILASEDSQEKTIDKPKIKKIIIWQYAAAFVGILLAVAYMRTSFQTPNVTKANSTQVPEQNVNAITLQLEDGTTQIISEEGTGSTVNLGGQIVGKQQGSQLIYDTRSKVEKLAYNTLKVPYGKKFELQLSDGTLVYLNSGTSLKYPVKFLNGEERAVFLQGEAFFDVKSDKEHPFIVHANDLNVEVLGTEFNVSNYQEDSHSDVVLVEGSVGMYNTSSLSGIVEKTIIEPGYKGSFNRGSNSIEIKKVTTEIYTSWMQGELVFRNMTFNNILKKMERHYNVTIVNRNTEFGNEEFNASFGNQPINKVLHYFETTYGIKFSVTGDTIYID